MPPAGFKPKISAGERPQTYAFGRAATGTGKCNVTQFIYLETALITCFGWYHHPSSGAQTTVSTASGICYADTAACRYRGRVGTGLSVLWVAYVTHSTLKPVPTLSRQRQ
jgi:hypothetical protein